jgi:hypothetical protein
MTNKEEIYDLVQTHPEWLDDDDITKMTGISVASTGSQAVSSTCKLEANSPTVD